MTRTLVARLDNAGDVLLAGPLVRSVARRSEVVLLCSPRGAAAAALLPGVGQIEVFDAPWIAADPPPMTRALGDALVGRLRALRLDAAIVATSDHQSPLPLALLLREAGVASIGAISTDYPGSLLDVRHRVPDDIHEVERNLSLAEACGHALPVGDPADLRVELDPTVLRPMGLPPRYVVVHPGASVPARTWTAEGFRSVVAALAARGRRAVVTGSRSEQPLTSVVAAGGALDLGGKITLEQLAVVLRGADALVVGNTGPAHLAAAVATPVVSLFPPTVPAVRWRPWAVPHRLLGAQHIACAGCRARDCPEPGQPCLGVVTVAEVLAAIDDLAAGRAGGRGEVPAGADERRGCLR